MTMIVVTQEMGFARDVADWVAFFDAPGCRRRPSPGSVRRIRGMSLAWVLAAAVVAGIGLIGVGALTALVLLFRRPVKR